MKNNCCLIGLYNSEYESKKKSCYLEIYNVNSEEIKLFAMRLSYIYKVIHRLDSSLDLGKVAMAQIISKFYNYKIVPEYCSSNIKNKDIKYIDYYLNWELYREHNDFINNIENFKNKDLEKYIESIIENLY